MPRLVHRNNTPDLYFPAHGADLDQEAAGRVRDAFIGHKREVPKDVFERTLKRLERATPGEKVVLANEAEIAMMEERSFRIDAAWASGLIAGAGVLCLAAALLFPFIALGPFVVLVLLAATAVIVAGSVFVGDAHAERKAAKTSRDVLRSAIVEP